MPRRRVTDATTQAEADSHAIMTVSMAVTHDLVGESHVRTQEHVDRLVEGVRGRRTGTRAAKSALILVVYIKTGRAGYTIGSHSVDPHTYDIVKRPVPARLLVDDDEAMRAHDAQAALRDLNEGYVDEVIQDHQDVLIRNVSGTCALALLEASRAYRGDTFRAYHL